MATPPRRILGISAYYHDSAACLLVDGQVLAAAQEERFTRKKHDATFPIKSVEYCLRAGGIALEDVDEVGFYEKPLLKFDRLLKTYLGVAPRGWKSYLAAMPQWLHEKLWLSSSIQQLLETNRPVLFGDHHESHAASAFYPSPFEEAAILTIDGVGEWTTSSIAHGRGNDLSVLREMHFPDSVGLLYSAFTYFMGFTVNEGEYKVMGLAPYGEPKYVDVIRDRLLELNDDGSIRLNLEYFEFAHGLTMTGVGFERAFGGPARQAHEPITQREMDLARSVQVVTEEIMLRMARTVHTLTGSRRLCLAGGVALNCVGNGRLLREGPFDHIWIQPAAGDAGGALGVAYAIWHRFLGQPRVSAERAGTWQSARSDRAPVSAYADGMSGALLGPEFSDDQIETWLRNDGIVAERLDSTALPRRIAEEIASGKVVGVCQGRMEFGPRALGCRSILADARSPSMQSVLNQKIKFRESFRPFAPAVLREHASEWFDLQAESPYMLLVADVTASRRITPPEGAQALQGLDMLRVQRLMIPAVTHVDGSARIQTVIGPEHAFFRSVLEHFYNLTGCPIVVNTSFNVRDEPIVCTPQDAYQCFMRTDIDILALGSFIVSKSTAKPAPRAPRNLVGEDAKV